MKKFIMFTFMLGLVLSSYAQEIIQLEEARLNFNPSAEVVFEDYENGVVKVKENYATQFQSDAIGFTLRNFDINRFIAESNLQKGDVMVTVRSSKGYLTATYDHKGNMLATTQRFKDIALPAMVRNEVYGQYQGWTMTKNKYTASGKEDNIDKEKYIVFLENGKDREKLKITPSALSKTGVASVEN